MKSHGPGVTPLIGPYKAANKADVHERRLFLLSIISFHANEAPTLVNSSAPIHWLALY